MALAPNRASGLPALRAKPVFSCKLARPVCRVVCSAQKDEEQSGFAKLAVPLATVIAAGLLTGAVLPEEALAARSGGRVGRSGFSSRRSSAP